MTLDRPTTFLSALLFSSLALGCSCGSDDESESGAGGGGATGGSAGSGASGGAGGATSGGAGGAGGTPSGGGSAGVSGGGGTGGGAGSDGAAGTDAGTDASADAADAGCSGAPPSCKGVCALTPPICNAGTWQCTGPGYEAVETSCDTFDNDCDGQVDEGCPTCAVDITRVNQNLFSIWDIDFDAQCNTYLTSLVSGPDFTVVVPAAAGDPVAKYFGNVNQNMGFGLVDPDPAQKRVIVNYSCCETCGCLGKNGLTLLYTCAPGSGCGCTGQTNCPGFLDAPFLTTGAKNTSVSANGFGLSTPTGLAVGPENTYYVGNFRPETCSSDTTTCTQCDPTHPSTFCSPAKPACCDSTPLGRLAQFTLPAGSTQPTFRVVATIAGEEIIGLASAGNSSVLVGTYAGASAGKLYRYDPVAGTLTSVASFGGAVYSITEDRKTGDVYVEILGTPKIHRLSSSFAPLALPSGVPASPSGEGVLQVGPDGKLYRLIGTLDATSTLTPYTL